VEQKQEEAGAMERQLIIFSLLFVFSCAKKEETLELIFPDSMVLVWTGEAVGGTRILVEQPFDAFDSSFVSEKKVLSQAFGLTEGEYLVRLHLVGGDGPIQSSGILNSNSGQSFETFGNPPPALSPRAKSLWIGLAQGGSSPSPNQNRRTFLLKTNRDALLGDLQWLRGDESIELTSHIWNGKQRLDYLAPAMNEKNG
jgi:hypothetical protein